MAWIRGQLTRVGFGEFGFGVGFGVGFEFGFEFGFGFGFGWTKAKEPQYPARSPLHMSY